MEEQARFAFRLATPVDEGSQQNHRATNKLED
jgi:hypothetical protein